MTENVRTERIKQMEERFDRSLDAAAALEEALDRYEEVREDLHILGNYYSGGEWRDDYEADEAGALPPGLKRGVLSEDGIFDLLTRQKELEERMQDYAEIL